MSEEYNNQHSENANLPFSAQPSPWLVIHHGENMEKQTFLNMLEDRYYVTTIPELENKKICACAFGWMVLLDRDSRDCYIWHPISKDKIELPPLPEYNCLKCILSAPPHEPQCQILFLDSDPNLEEPSVLYFCKPGYHQEEEFHEQELQMGDNNLHSWTMFKGKLYGLTLQYPSALVLLDVDNDSVTVTTMCNQPAYDYKGFIDMTPQSPKYLVQFNDMLLCVIELRYGWQMKEIYGFVVFRFDFVKRCWVEVKSICEAAIFLGESWGITCSTRGTNLEGDSIYSIHEGRLCVFNLKTQSISLSLPCPHVNKTNSRSYWLTLPYSECN